MYRYRAYSYSSEYFNGTMFASVARVGLRVAMTPAVHGITSRLNGVDDVSAELDSPTAPIRCDKVGNCLMSGARHCRRKQLRCTTTKLLASGSCRSNGN